MSVGSHFRAPLSTKLLSGTEVPLTDSSGNVVGANGNKIPSTFFMKLGQANYGKADGILPFACVLASVRERHSTAEATAGSLTVMVNKVPSGTAASGGTACLSAGIDMKGTADTNASGSLNATAANYTFAAGDSVAGVLSGAATELAGSSLTLEFQAL